MTNRDHAAQEWAQSYLKNIAEQPDAPADDEDMAIVHLAHPAAGDPYGRIVRYPRVVPKSNAPLVFPPAPDN